MFDAEFSVGRTRTSIANSAGASASYSQTTFDSSISGTLVRGTDMLFVGEWKSGCSPDWDVEKLLERTRRQLEWSRETADAPEGRLPVLFMPRAVGNVLLGPFFSGINGRSVVQGSSPLGGRVGETIFDPRLTIVDAPTTPMKPRSRPWDDEGVPSRDQPLVDRGVLKTILYDLQTAGQGGTETTGSASRDLGEMPRPSTSYLRIEPGDRNFDELVAEMGEGVIVEEMIGMGQGNVLGGDAGGNILLGYAVHGGEIVGRIKDTMLHCNIYEVLKQVRGIGSEVDELGGRLASPAIVCDGVSISPAGDS
jgi:PmbA protein